MKKIKSVTVDDEPGNIIILKELLRQYCTCVDIAGTAADSLQAAEVIRDVQPHLLFLDIEMPYGNGFDLLDRISPVDFEVIFITAFDQYAIKAFRYAALDYILKPVKISELKEAVEKATCKLETNTINSRIPLLLNNLRPENQAFQKIALPTANGLVFEEVNNITHLTAEGNYTSIHTREKKKTLVAKGLIEYEAILPATHFCRVHHAHIINLDHVKKYYKGRGGYVEMENGIIISISARKKEEFLSRFY